MKKTLSVILIATLAVSSVVGVTATVAMGDKLDTANSSVVATATKIATAKTSVTLDLTKDGNIVRGKSDFSFTDSFGNSGNGSISVCENVITIVIDELVDLGRGWSIGNATGDYILHSY